MYCGHSKTHKRGKTKRGDRKYQRYICERCQKSFSELAGTIYEDRHLTPTDIDLIIECRNQGMNFAQAARKVGVSPKAVSNLLKTTCHKHPAQSNDSLAETLRERVNPVNSPPDTASHD
jgi:transposase-like protein